MIPITPPQVSEPPSVEKRLTVLEQAVREIRHELSNRFVSAEGNVIEHIKGNYTLLVDGITVLRSELYTVLSAPEVHLNPEEFQEGIPAEMPEKLKQE